MNWRYKALLQLAFSNMPLSERLNYFFQRYVTKSLPTTDAKFVEIVSAAFGLVSSISASQGNPFARRVCQTPIALNPDSP